MCECLGSLESVSGVSFHEPFYSAILNFNTWTYETGIDCVPRFDSHLTVYGGNQAINIEYDTLYIKGLPIQSKVDETNEHGEMVTREICSSYEEAYTVELKEMHACLMEGKPIKTSAEEALQDLRLFEMLYDQCERQLSH